eukprot:442798_1
MKRSLLLIYVAILIHTCSSSEHPFKRYRFNTIQTTQNDTQNEDNIFDKIHAISLRAMEQMEDDDSHLYIIGLNTTPHTNVLDFAETVLQLMINWYDHRMIVSNVWINPTSFKINPLKIRLLLASIDQFKRKQLSQTVYFFKIQSLMTQIVNVDKRFDILHQLIYYCPFISWISKNRFKFISKIGSGTQAIVIKVQDVNNGTRFALKIFKNSFDCFYEMMILNRIKDEFYSGNLHSINVPKIVSDPDISCKTHSAILMQYINGVDLTYYSTIAPIMLNRLWEQISDVIIQLANIGIGHFDINRRNILVDNNSNFWLIDFGFGISINDTNPKDFQFTIIGTWLFYSPQAYELDKMMKKISQSVGYNITATDKTTIKKLITDANLYSLQALMFFVSNCSANNKAVSNLATHVEDYWNVPGVRDITKDIHRYLLKIWAMRGVTVQYYLRYNNTKRILQRKHVNLLLYKFTDGE